MAVKNIKKDTSLRKAILQAAITGQLISTVVESVETAKGECLPLAAAGKPSSATPSAGTPRNAPTETGKQLLERIIEERNKKLLAEWEEALKKNPKAKKPAPIVASEIDEDEIPFEIPENWCWCRLGDVCELITKGSSPSWQGVKYVSDGILFITSENVGSEKLIFENTKYLEPKFNELQFRSILKKGDILTNIVGASIGRTAIFDIDIENANINQAVAVIRLYLLESNTFIMKALNAPFIIEQMLDNTVDTARANISLATVSQLILPLPPLSVQNAIVAKLEQVLPLVDAYENAVLQKEELKSSLSDKVKKAILQEAITGKLKIDNGKLKINETGKELLARIIKERNEKALAEWEEKVKINPKAKKPVPIVASEIEEEEIPFEIPESWCWCKLGDVGDFVRGSGIKRDETKPEGYPCIRYGEMYTKYRNTIKETLSFVDKNVFDSCQKIHKNDIVMALTGENEYDIALAAVYQGDKEVAMGGDMTRLRPYFVNPLYLVFTLNSPYGIQCKSELATGNIIVHISNDKLESIMIPLPPLEEQDEIVKKVEELMEVWR